MLKGIAVCLSDRNLIKITSLTSLVVVVRKVNLPKLVCIRRYASSLSVTSEFFEGCNTL